MVLIVEEVIVKICPKCDTVDRSTKFGTNVPHDVSNHFRRGAQKFGSRKYILTCKIQNGRQNDTHFLKIDLMILFSHFLSTLSFELKVNKLLIQYLTLVTWEICLYFFFHPLNTKNQPKKRSTWDHLQSLLVFKR